MGKLSSQQQHAASGMEEIEKAGGGKKKDRLEREKRLCRYTVCVSGDKSRGLTNFPSIFFDLCVSFLALKSFPFQHLYALCISRM